MQEVKTGTYTGTGAALSISLGFVPQHIAIANVTDGDISWEWYQGMADGTALQTTNHASAQKSVLSAGGVSAFPGEPFVAAPGFSIGAALSEDGKTFSYRALRGGPGAQG